eukprot:TRINITY_DN277_c0_g1_i4.p1 TRINITY_DN277_c0_g1~~TRINITY_DN277_c0_g1_i4.p1  ORF type:complete len:249 (-),score=10.00 TRINITY_DN277_c0_g1_i4:117-863(-)
MKAVKLSSQRWTQLTLCRSVLQRQKQYKRTQIGRLKRRRIVADSVVGVERDNMGKDIGDGVFLIVFTNITLFVLDKVMNQSWVKMLYLRGSNPQWWQFVSCGFCHATFQHLTSNLFMLYVFGKIVEQEEGTWGLLLTYIMCSLGGVLMSYLFTQKKQEVVFLGASGAVFGLFVFSLITKMKFHLKKLIEAVVLAPFVWQQVVGELKSQLSGGAVVGAGLSISHIAHLGGVLSALLLFYGLALLAGSEK